MVVILKNICTFVEQNHFRRDSKINIYDKRLLKVISTERAVTPFLKWFCTPKGNLAHKFFKMQNKKKNVNDSANAASSPVQKLHDLIIDYAFTRNNNSKLFTEPLNEKLLW